MRPSPTTSPRPKPSTRQIAKRRSVPSAPAQSTSRLAKHRREVPAVERIHIQRAMASPLAREAPLEPVHQLARREDDDEVDQRRHREDLERPERLLRHLVGLEQQVGVGDDGDQRRRLHQLDRALEEGRDHALHGLRQDDAAHHLARRHADRARALPTGRARPRRCRRGTPRRRTPPTGSRRSARRQRRASSRPRSGSAARRRTRTAGPAAAWCGRPRSPRPPATPAGAAARAASAPARGRAERRRRAPRRSPSAC